ncbi:hypothetical protein PENTCL1PPCAC_22332, partial [Pristionchus entomophagus]
VSVMASWFGWGGSSAPTDAPSSPSTSEAAPELRLYGDDLRPSGHASFTAAPPQNESASTMEYSPAPVLALDQLKHAGVPLNRQMTPYLQIDPSMFAAAQPQYVAPDGGVGGKGRFEFALGHIGWAVAAGFGVGSVRGALPEMLDKDTKALRGKPWLTRMANATVKHGSGFAQPAGAIVFMYSVLEIGLRQLRADDDLNSIGAGGLAGAIYRSPHGARAIAIGTGVGMALSTAWVLINEDSRERMANIFSK